METAAEQIGLPALGDMPLRVLLLVTVLGLCVRYIVDLFRKNPRHVKLAKTFPGPPTLPFVGNSVEFSDEKVGLSHTLRKYEEKYGSIYRLWFGKNLVIGTTDLALISIIFQSSKTLDKPHFFLGAGIEFWGDENIFIAPTPLWKKTRKGMQPFFTKNSLAANIPRINRSVRTYTAKLDKYAVDGSPFDMGHILNLLSFEIILEIVLNASLDCPEKDLEKLSACMQNAEMILSDKILKPWFCNKIADIIYYRKTIKDFQNELNDFYEKVKSRQILSEEDKTSGSESPLIHLLHQIKDNLGLKEDYVKLESVHMIGASSVTTSHVASFSFLMVAMHPDVQEKLYAEIVDTLGLEDRDLGLDELNKLPYLDQVLKEAERRFLHDPVMFRNVYEDIQYGKYKVYLHVTSTCISCPNLRYYIYVHLRPRTIPAGSSVMIASSAIHMSPKYYKAPERFDPDHFCAEAVRKRPKLAFFPFSAGARNCPGKAYAETQLKLFMVKFLQRFKFSTKEKMENLEVIAGFRLFLEEYEVSVQRRDREYSIIMSTCDLDSVK